MELGFRLEIIPILKDTRLDQHADPCSSVGRLVIVGAHDVALGVVADHVDFSQAGELLRVSSSRSLLSVVSFGALVDEMMAVFVESFLRKSVGQVRGFPNHGSSKLRTTGEATPDSLQRVLEGSLAQAGKMVSCCPEKIRIAEIEWRLVVLLVAILGERFISVPGEMVPTIPEFESRRSRMSWMSKAQSRGS